MVDVGWTEIKCRLMTIRQNFKKPMNQPQKVPFWALQQPRSWSWTRMHLCSPCRPLCSPSRPRSRPARCHRAAFGSHRQEEVGSCTWRGPEVQTERSHLNDHSLYIIFQTAAAWMLHDCLQNWSLLQSAIFTRSFTQLNAQKVGNYRREHRTFKKEQQRTVPPMCAGRYSGPMNVWTSDLEANLSLLMASGPSHVFTIFHAAGIRLFLNAGCESWLAIERKCRITEQAHHSWSKAYPQWSFWLKQTKVKRL